MDFLISLLLMTTWGAFCVAFFALHELAHIKNVRRVPALASAGLPHIDSLLIDVRTARIRYTGFGNGGRALTAVYGRVG